MAAKLRPYFGTFLQISTDDLRTASSSTSTNGSATIVSLTIPKTGHWAAGGIVTGSCTLHQIDGAPGFTIYSNFDGTSKSQHWGSDSNNSGDMSVNAGFFGHGTWSSGTVLQIWMDTGWHIDSRSVSGAIYAHFVPTSQYRI